MGQVKASQTGIWMAMTASANVISWQAAAITLAALIISGVMQLLNEWQRRKTIKELISGAQSGTVVVLSDSPGGQTLKARLESRPSRQPDVGP
jgi:hypothetical protein